MPTTGRAAQGAAQHHKAEEMKIPLCTVTRMVIVLNSDNLRRGEYYPIVLDDRRGAKDLEETMAKWVGEICLYDGPPLEDHTILRVDGKFKAMPQS